MSKKTKLYIRLFGWLLAFWSFSRFFLPQTRPKRYLQGWHSLSQQRVSVKDLHPVIGTIRRSLQHEGVKGQLDDVCGVSSHLPRAVHKVRVEVWVLRRCKRTPPFCQYNRLAHCKNASFAAIRKTHNTQTLIVIRSCFMFAMMAGSYCSINTISKHTKKVTKRTCIFNEMIQENMTMFGELPFWSHK